MSKSTKSNTSTAKPKKALYPYTLQPVSLNLSVQEFKDAQLALFNKTLQNNPARPRPKEWWIMGILCLIAIAGIVLVSGYRAIIFWLILIIVALYLLLRTMGLKWYMQKEYEKQIASTTMPDEMAHVKLGLQPHGLVLILPAPHQNTPKGFKQNNITRAQRQAVIPWQSVTSWDSAEDFIFVLFSLHGQNGSQIIPKRLNNQGFNIKTLTKHLTNVCQKGLKADDMATIAQNGGGAQ